jgi:hypothetical protein
MMLHGSKAQGLVAVAAIEGFAQSLRNFSRWVLLDLQLRNPSVQAQV